MNNEQNTPNEVQAPAERNRKIMRVVGVILVIVVIAALAGNGRWGRPMPASTVTEALPDGCMPGYLFSETTGKPCPQPTDAIIDTEPTTPAPTTSVSVSTPSAYKEAMRMYEDKIVSFDASCKPTPATPGFAVGTRILISNESPQTLTLSVAGRTEELDAYHYFTVPLKTAGDVVATCNGAAAATIVVK